MRVLVKGLLAFSLMFFLVACDDDDDDNDRSSMSIVDVAAEAGSFTTLVTALQATGLDSTLADPEGNFTVFAPSDAAFEKLGEETINNLLADTDTLADILLYHVIVGATIDSTAAIESAGTTVEMANGDNVALSLSGSDLLVNFSTVTGLDIMADNGIIHVIDTVLIPPTESEEPVLNIAETATANGNFTTLLTALAVAGLDSALADESATYTVFAPTDAAFAALPDGTIAALLADIDALTAVLARHVISGAAVDSVTALSLNNTEVETLLGENVSLQIIDGALMVNNAKIEIFDIVTTNGIIHVIDAVISES
ncbi:fasciclin domain-containing protein [Oceanicoccus sagamiensis]|uniref:FAS1 domain-containing protein n=1 Tax=Oceanicoccus sagamiensis TaxID=716816 RepID=A0A1X9NFF0_9GAMM|nr:fasciclin domain-containing protein [Oceanicoccus sagamiensis]ARN75152.1 hypothetical protein BST96_14125 [Oceanicoccus sagamiensis]